MKITPIVLLVGVLYLLCLCYILNLYVIDWFVVVVLYACLIHFFPLDGLLQAPYMKEHQICSWAPSQNTLLKNTEMRNVEWLTQIISEKKLEAAWFIGEIMGYLLIFQALGKKSHNFALVVRTNPYTKSQSNDWTFVHQIDNKSCNIWFGAARKCQVLVCLSLCNLIWGAYSDKFTDFFLIMKN